MNLFTLQNYGKWRARKEYFNFNNSNRISYLFIQHTQMFSRFLQLDATQERGIAMASHLYLSMMLMYRNHIVGILQKKFHC